MTRIQKFVKRLFQPILLIFKELGCVEWISIKQTVQSTLMVLVISVITGIIIVVFDTTLFEGRDLILNL